jgi:hypothetical protein
VLTVSVPCEFCDAKLRIGDDFCPECGRRVSDETKRALRERWEASDSSAAERQKHLRTASGTIAVLGVLFMLGGALMFFVMQGQVDDALLELRRLPGDMTVPEPISGQIVTVDELRRQVQSEPLQVLGLNLFLALVMAGLFIWSRRSPTRAALTTRGSERRHADVARHRQAKEWRGPNAGASEPRWSTWSGVRRSPERSKLDLRRCWTVA